MISDARRGHVSPGIYTEEKDVVFSVKSLGITSLGLVGETLYGPAFQNVEISSWGEFVDYFGGTSAEKFKNGNPKYELPYIAKTYLKNSKQLEVCRILGLSGFDYGKAWTIYGTKEGSEDKYLIAILRSKASYKTSNIPNVCEPTDEQDKIQFLVTDVTMSPYTTIESVFAGCDNTNTSKEGELKVGLNKYGTFKLTIKTEQNEETVALSLNPGDKNYIVNVLGTSAQEGDYSLFVEEFYDLAHIKVCDSENRVYDTINIEGIDGLNNYKEMYRCAFTPWFVSELKGNGSNVEIKKLFRFYTISDGNAANSQIKITIANILPDEGLFDVIIRDINDSDESVIILEKFANCTLTPGDSTYIAYKIGSFDGIYEVKSKYVTVEVNESLITQNSVPAGFLGYPLCQYDEMEIYGNNHHVNVIQPTIQYNLSYNQDIKNRRQYFGLSSSVGIDIDMFTYKGQMAYGEDARFLSQGFHLDSRIASGASYTPLITVDGESGYTFDCLSVNERTNQYQEAPIIGTEIEMEGSIFENVDLRKFTAYFYGGFDGWDIYREARTNTDEYKINKYQGEINKENGEGNSFNRMVDAESLNINQPAITSDWYAYLAGVRQFANPEEIDINVFATPGIDIINNTSLVEEVIEMIEEERADSIYVVTTPDKPFGAEDYINEMYTPSDIVYELEDTNVDSNYTCTYYPWIKYHDKDNNKYIFLPPTKDVVRNMAMTDNTAHPWFAPAGISRGDVNCTRAKLVTKLGDEDVLYAGRINPVKTFASDGVKIWGQKNLQIKESQLNRIAVRRLLLRLRKLISIACIGLIFEPNDPTTKQKFLSTVTPIFDNIKSNRGISDYRIEVNDSPESRDRRELPVKLYFKPYQALEYITLDFIVTPESVSFDSI